KSLAASATGALSWHRKTTLHKALVVGGGTKKVNASPGTNSSLMPSQLRTARFARPVNGVRTHVPPVDCSTESGTQTMCALVLFVRQKMAHEPLLGTLVKPIKRSEAS